MSRTKEPSFLRTVFKYAIHTVLASFAISYLFSFVNTFIQAGPIPQFFFNLPITAGVFGLATVVTLSPVDWKALLFLTTIPNAIAVAFINSIPVIISTLASYSIVIPFLAVPSPQTFFSFWLILLLPIKVGLILLYFFVAQPILLGIFRGHR